MTPAVDRLRRVQQALVAGEPVADDDAQMLVSAITRLLDHGEPLDKALGVRRRGGVSPARRLALARRDAALVRLWQTTQAWRDLTPAAAARLMVMSFRRYEMDRWKRERKSVAGPAAEPAATWWQILAAGLRLPGGDRLGHILAGLGAQSSL